MKLVAVVRNGKDGSWWIDVPDLPGLYSCLESPHHTKEEAMPLLKSALHDALGLYVEEGLLPKRTTSFRDKFQVAQAEKQAGHDYVEIVSVSLPKEIESLLRSSDGKGFGVGL